MGKEHRKFGEEDDCLSLILNSECPSLWTLLLDKRRELKVKITRNKNRQG